MDWEALYNWFTQKAGVSYDFNEDLGEIGGDTPFNETFFWSMKIGFILDDMESAIEVVEENWRELTEELPSRDKLKKLFTEDTISKLANNINDVKKKLGLKIDELTDAEDIMENVVGLRDLISMLSVFSIEDLQKRNWFEEYDESSDGLLSDTLGIHKNDLVDIHQNIETILEGYKDEDDDEDDNEDDEDTDEE